MSLGVGLEPYMICLMGVFIWMSVADFQTMEIPDAAQIALVGVAGWGCIAGEPPDFSNRLVGAALWALLVWTVGFGYATWRGWHGLGFGDVKLMGGIGFLLGFTPVIPVLGVASASAAASLIAVWLLQGERRDVLSKTPVAFGPFLCLSAWVIWLLGE